MSVDPHPFSSASAADRELVVGNVYPTASGRELRVESFDDLVVVYTIVGAGRKSYARYRRTFLAAIR